MLNEKMAMEHKLFSYTIICILAGFFTGGACVFFAISAVFGGAPGFAGAICLIIATALAFTNNKVYQQIREFIKRPYVGDPEDENEKTDLDTTLD